MRSRIARRIFGRAEVLVAARHLCGLPGIATDEPACAVAYVHSLLARHEIVFANGAATESMVQAPRGP